MPYALPSRRLLIAAGIFTLALASIILSASTSRKRHAAEAFERLASYAYPPQYASIYSQPKSLQHAVTRSEALWKHNVAKRAQFIEDNGGLDEMRMFSTKPWGHVQRYTLWDIFVPAFPCPWEVERVGRMGDGGKYTCGLPHLQSRRGEDLVVYSFGVEKESSWEAELLGRTEGSVWMYDFSVETYGPQLQQAPANISDRAHFFPYGLSKVDEEKDGHQFYSLRTLMAKNGHDHIDILKVDVEGAEFTILPELVADFGEGNLPFDQLLLEIHASATPRAYNVADFNTWWEGLERAGLRMYMSELNYPAIHWDPYPSAMEVSFLNNCNGREKCGYLLRT